MSKSKEKKAGKRLTKHVLVDKLNGFFSLRPDEVFSLKAISAALHLTTHPLKRMCFDILEEMVSDAFLKKISSNEYQLNTQGAVMTGIFQRKSNGKNVFIPEDGGEPIMIAERNSAHALNNDKVKIGFFARRRNRTPEGEVIEILQRADATFVGTLKIDKYYAFLLTENRTLANDIFIPKGKLKGGQNGDKAIAKIIDWPEDAKNPIGQIIDVLGKTGENNAEMHAILAEYGLPYVYPAAVEKAAEKLTREITQQDITEREDFRNVTTFTIDPKDAKDFDDALSIRKLASGSWEVGVHIADVTHYVKESTIIDKEAYKRATSVYLVDRTVPMLPESLCNVLCSLRPNEEKLTFSVIFVMNDKAEVLHHRIVHTIIKSDRRFCYEEAQEIIETGKGDYAEEILELNKLARILRKNRMVNGAIDFQRIEMKFDIDEKGKPIGVYFKESKEANQLIEEFMLLANRTVAESVGKASHAKKAKVFPYRIHDVPEMSKLEDLNTFINKFGYKIRTSGSKGEVAKSLNRLMSDVRNKKEQELIETVTLRTMQKAHYSVHNIGHYGLAFDFYTHFTSPIRRYPDMMVHRLLTRYLGGGRTVSADKYEEFCEHCSDMEQIAANAERDSIKYKMVEYMSERIGQVYDGTISGVTEWGIYVEIDENKCEGMVPVHCLSDDYYVFDDKNYCLVGRRHKNKYSLGDAVKIKVVRADLVKKQLDFDLVNDEKSLMAPAAL
ncbi:MAG: ribonuclease R [Phocaeicola sp.]|uniref:ribonuclease R n=1 Tax=Phocaeicola sp. TaxID=2773926 RepID=UPI003FA02178